MKKITIPVFSAFAGYDSQFLALRRFAGWFNQTFKGLFHIEFDLIGWCEIDPDAITSHNALFPEYKGRHYKDITKIMWGQVPHFDILIYSSCCQDISRNGNQAGLTKGSGTRSSLIWHVLDALKERKPAVAILENVAALLENPFCNEFRKWTDDVDKVGYRSGWGTLLASDFGVAQNRNRAFVVSTRTDLAHNIYLPAPRSHCADVESVLEDMVDNKYYYTVEDAFRFIIAMSGKDAGVVKKIKIDNLGECVKRIFTPTCKSGEHRVSPTLLANSNYEKTNYKNFISTGHYPSPAVLEVWETTNEVNVPYSDFISSTKGFGMGVVNASNDLVMDALQNLSPKSYFRLRKLTPRECFRLMDVDEVNINKLISSGVPEAQLYKLAGNAIVVDVLFHLYKSVFTLDLISKMVK